MPTTDRKLRVFLCHASQDKPSVNRLYNLLKDERWIQPWLDEEELLPGQEWAKEIPQAVRQNDVVLVCLSKNSVTKEGYIQREISYALDIAEEKPEGTIFIIPIKLEECQVPGRLRRWQWLDYFKPGAHDKLMKSLQYRADGLGLSDIRSREELGLVPPITQAMTTYVLGYDLYDESFSVESLSGDFIGEFGASIIERIGKSEPRKFAALEVWMFEEHDIKTVTKVLMSFRAYYDPLIRKRLEPKGELLLIEPQKQITLETVSLQLLVSVVDLVYGKDGAPSNSYFERVTLEMAVWPKL